MNPLYNFHQRHISPMTYTAGHKPFFLNYWKYPLCTSPAPGSGVVCRALPRGARSYRLKTERLYPLSQGSSNTPACAIRIHWVSATLIKSSLCLIESLPKQRLLVCGSHSRTFWSHRPSVLRPMCPTHCELSLVILPAIYVTVVWRKSHHVCWTHLALIIAILI